MKPTIHVVSAEIQQEGRYLISQRLPTAVLPLLWEFPGGRVREGEGDEQALVRAVEHRLGIRVAPRQRVLEVAHEYDAYDVVLRVYRCDVAEGEPRARAVHALAWVTVEELGEYSFPGADQQTIELLLQELE